MSTNIDEIIKSPLGYVFAAIDFSSKYKYIYEDVIYPAVVDAGLKLVRSDEVSSDSTDFCQQIRLLIQNSRFVIADATFIRQSSFGNILLEIGITLALGRPFLILSQDNDEDIPSDIRSLRRAKYEASEQGKYTLKTELTAILLETLNPPAFVLKKMLPLNDWPNHIIFGHAEQSHIRQVFPPVDPKYEQRLGEISSEASGISQLTIALHKVGWGIGKDIIDIRPVNSHMMTEQTSLNGNIYVFGGPGANRYFRTATQLASSLYENALDIQCEDVANEKKQYYIAKSGKKYPEEQYKLYAEKKDVGFLMRFPNPDNPDAVIVVAAGIRSYGTEGAIQLLTTPSLISKITFWEELDKEEGFWAIVEVSYDKEDRQTRVIRISDAELLKCRRKAKNR